MRLRLLLLLRIEVHFDRIANLLVGHAHFGHRHGFLKNGNMEWTCVLKGSVVESGGIRRYNAADHALMQEANAVFPSTAKASHMVEHGAYVFIEGEGNVLDWKLDAFCRKFCLARLIIVRIEPVSAPQ